MNIACVVIRLFALYVFMQNAYFVPLIVFNLGNAVGFLSTFLNLAICLLLFFRPQTVLFGLDFQKASGSDYRISAGVLQSAGVAILGLYFLLSGLQSALSFYLSWSDSRFQSVIFNEVDFWTATVEVSGGLLLIVMSGGISNLITWLRQLGPRVEDR